jgi:hypothetical protein
MLSTAIAHQILQQESPQTIDKVKVILAYHPWQASRWQDSLTLAANEDLMLFMLSASWADDIRSG